MPLASSSDGHSLQRVANNYFPTVHDISDAPPWASFRARSEIIHVHEELNYPNFVQTRIVFHHSFGSE